MTDLRKLKEKASEAFAKGKFAKAAELYADYCQQDKKDTQAKLRMGDAFSKSGEKTKAIRAYRTAAEDYAKEGFLPRAIAASKLILELDPAHTGMQQLLADLYAKRTGGPAAPGKPAPPKAHVRPREIELPPDDSAPTPDDATPPKAAVPAAVESALFSAPGGNLIGGSQLTPELELEVQTAAHEAETEETIDLTEAAEGPADLDTPIGINELAAHVEALNPTPADAVPLDRPKTPSGPSGGSSDLLAALSKFDELDMNDGASLGSAPSDARAPPSSPSASAPARKTVASAPPGLTRKAKPSFTELELENDSLLHAVELAAQLGEATATASEESFSIGAELVEESSAPGALPKIPLFSDLPPNAFIELFDRCPLRRFTSGERVFAQGSQGDSFFVICAGKVGIFREANANRQRVAELDEGAFFGEMALLSGAPRTATVEALAEDTQLLEIPAPVLADLSAKHPTVAQALKKFCRQRMLSNVMASSALFRPFDKKERRALVERFRSRDVPKGTALLREGEISDGLYIVLSGELEVKASGQTLAKLKEADVFGEMSLLNRAPAGATVTTTKHTSLLRLPRPDFDQLISTHPQILMLVSELTDDRRKQNEAVLGGAAAVGDEGLLLV
ncbi:MAG: cyclic nucleotide-binding domain-containing protein [Myxococcaceae bacterium]